MLQQRNPQACSVLAKILMVTKLSQEETLNFKGSVLAKILMVTKQYSWTSWLTGCSVLAKILMVTKLTFTGISNG